MIRLATVSPCYNEEDVLRHSVEKLTSLFQRMIADGLITRDSMMVFVNDGSRDGTWELIRQLHAENHFVRGINMSRNVGHQNAIMAGLMTARGWTDAIITLDVDLHDDIECIPKMVKEFEAGYDIVYGVEVSHETDGFMKKFTAQTFYKIQTTMGVENVYNHADFRLMSRRALDMLSTYKEHNLYLRGLIPLIGLKHTTVDDVISERNAGKSKNIFQKMLNLVFNGITAFSVRPLYAIYHIGIIFLIVAFIVACYVGYSILFGHIEPGWASLMLSIWIVGGFILISMGIVGTYIGQIYSEAKRRPLYHIAEILA